MPSRLLIPARYALSLLRSRGPSARSGKALPRFGRVVLATALLACMLALAGITHAAPAAVSIDGFRFLPQSVTVNAGEAVTWTNRDPA